MSEVRNQRRYYLLKAQYNSDTAENAILAEGYWAKQEELPGTDLPDDFPARAKLLAAHYRALEDLDGADADELVAQTDLTRREAEAVVQAIGD